MKGPMQLLLDLFSDANRPAQRASAGLHAIESIADATLNPARPLAFAHGEANRQAVLEGVAISFLLRRRRRRTIGFVVGADGLVVSAPKWVPLYEIDAAVQEKSTWILARLREMREREARMEATRIAWRDGATFPYLGEPAIVVIDPRHRFEEAGAVLHSSGDTLPGVARHALHIGIANDAQPAQIRDAVQAWLMKEARRVFLERLDHFAPKLGVQWNKLSLSGASTRWGSASANGSIRLNWRLIHFRPEVIDYVVAHELSHLRVMDHSPRFWDTVESVMPGYAALRTQLRDDAIPRWD